MLLPTSVKYSLNFMIEPKIAQTMNEKKNAIGQKKKPIESHVMIELESQLK